MKPGKIVARYADGRMLKGYSYNFNPNNPNFQLYVDSAGAGERPVEVFLDELKAVFFVKDFGGNPSYEERKRFSEEDRPSGRKIEVTFSDGEILVGTVLGYKPWRSGFFLFPVDPQSNNLKVFAVSAAVKAVRYLDEPAQGQPDIVREILPERGRNHG